MHDQPDIGIDPHRPEILILGAVELVEGESRCGRIHLQVEGGGFHRLLLLGRQPRQAVGERVGDAEFHGGSWSYIYS
jgi:hypothetical protein